MWKGTLWPFERFVVDFIYKVLLSAARNRATIGRRTKRARSFWITRKMTVERMAAIYDDFVIVEHPVTVEEALKQVHSSGARLLVVRSRREIVGVCDAHGLLLQLGQGTAELACSEPFAVVDEEALFQQRPDQASFWLIQNDRGEIIGWLDAVTMENVLMKRKLSQDVTELTKDLEAIVDSIYDEILVVDATGTILRVSNRSANNLWGVHLSTVVGKNILDLEEKGWFKPSVTRKVLEEKRKISIVQQNRFGRKILAVGNPIFNKKRQLERIVIASRDITEVTELKNELQRAKSLTQKYKEEIDELRNHQFVAVNEVIYRSEAMARVMEQVKRIALVESTVILYGESGVGKELIANAIHNSSARREKPFVKINCGAIPENLLESELFGYEKGAFSGASLQGKKGLFELAHEGTLFLDEIAEMPLNLQVKLLRALQEREILKVGGTRPIPVDVRIIAATNKNLEEMVQRGQFREDLYYRLHVIPLYIPALRERIEDVEPLVYAFLEKFNKKFSTRKYFSEDAIDMLNAYHWPGNVRQLQNVIERAMVISPGNLITANELTSILSHRAEKDQPPVQVNRIIPLKEAVELTESQLIQLALAKYKTITKVAEVLEVSQPTLSRRFQKISRNRKQETKP